MSEGYKLESAIMMDLAKELEVMLDDDAVNDWKTHRLLDQSAIVEDANISSRLPRTSKHRARRTTSTYTTTSASSSSNSSRRSSSPDSLLSEPSSASTGTSSTFFSSCCCQANLELRTSSFRLPLRLPRPKNVQVLDYTLLTLDPDLKHVPLPYILDSLLAQGPYLLRTLRETSVCIPETPQPLPSLLRVNLATASAVASPDYVLAITSDDNPRTLLLPVHGLVMATNTKSLSALSRSYTLPDTDNVNKAKQESQDMKDSGCHSIPTTDEPDMHSPRTKLPVISLHLPSASAFSLLVPYFYTLSSASLLSSLLPTCPPINSHPVHDSATPSSFSSSSSSIDILLADTPNILANRLSVLKQDLLLEHVNVVHKVWQTAVALGAGRDDLWRTMEVAWSVLVGALAVKEGRNISVR